MENWTVYEFHCGGPLLLAPSPLHLAPVYLRVATRMNFWTGRGLAEDVGEQGLVDLAAAGLGQLGQ